MDIYIHSITPKKMTPRGLEFDDSLKRFWKEWMNTKKGRVVDIKLIKPGDKLDWALRTGVALTRIIDLGLNIPVGIASNFGAQISAYRGLGAKAYALGNRRAFTKEGRVILKKYKPLVGESVFEKIRSTQSNISDDLRTGLFGLFSFADRKARQTFLLGSLTPEELKSGVISGNRLADIKLAMGRQMVIDGAESVIGKTAVGKVYGQYKSWAVPLLSSTLDDLSKLQKALKERDANYLKTPEFAELMRTILISATVGIGAHQILTDTTPMKNKNFLEKLAYKAANDLLSLLGALNPAMWLIPARTQQFVAELGTGITQILIAAKDSKGNLKGPKHLQDTIVPGAVRQFIPSGSSKKKNGTPGLPKVPNLPKAPKLPKVPKLPKFPNS